MKTILPIFFFVLFGLFISCSETSVEPEPNQKTSTNYISEVYFVRGTVIERSGCFPCTGDIVHTYDTTEIVSAVSLKYLDENPDSVQFFGLNGANSGRPSVYPQDCRSLKESIPESCTYAKYENSTITLDLFQTGTLYHGNGTLESGRMSFNAFYQYRGDSIGYDLTGQRVEELGGLDEPEYFKTGLYFVGGEKIITKYSAWPIPDGEEPDVDTVRVNFTMNIEAMDDQETIRLVGLPGADSGTVEDRVYPNCTSSGDCIILGESTGIEEFEVDIEDNGRTYEGSGIVRTVDFEMTGQYQHQNTTIDYNLSGQRYFEQ